MILAPGGGFALRSIRIIFIEHCLSAGAGVRRIRHKGCINAGEAGDPNRMEAA